MVLLTSILKNESHRHPLVILQSSLAQSSLPILCRILAQDTSAKGSPLHNVLFCLLYQPSSLTGISSPNSVEVYDWTDRVPGYGESDYWAELLSIVEKGMSRNVFFHPLFRSILLPALDVPTRSTNIIIDSVDTTLEDTNSPAETYKYLSKVCKLVKKHSSTFIS